MVSIYQAKNGDSGCTGGVENCFVVDEAHKRNWERYNIDDHCRTCNRLLNFGTVAYTKRGKPYCILCALNHRFLDREDLEFLKKGTREAYKKMLTDEELKTGFKPRVVLVGRREVVVGEGQQLIISVQHGEMNTKLEPIPAPMVMPPG